MMSSNLFGWKIFFVMTMAVAVTVSSLPTASVEMPVLRGTSINTISTTTATSRSMEATSPSALTTTNCNVIRTEEYQAELQLIYEYWVEFKKDGSRSLTGIENAISHAVAQDLDACDALDRPLYKVKANTRHSFSKTEYCVPQVRGNTCSVVVGATAILLDSNSAKIQEKAYGLIGSVLNNTDVLGSFAPSVARAQYIKPLGNTLVFSPESDSGNSTAPGSVTATIAVAAASVSFVVASIFCYGLLRRDMHQHPEPSIRHKNRLRRGRQIVGNNPPMGTRPRPHSFVRLEDFAVSPDGQRATIVTGSFSPSTIVTSPRDYTPSITWSISDITSDSASLRSNVSRRTSNLERIEEEDEESDHDGYESEEEDEDDYHDDNTDRSSDIYIDSEPNLPPSPVYRFSPIKYARESFFQESHEVSELYGCQFVEDDVVNTTTTSLNMNGTTTVTLHNVMPDVDDDLQVSLDDDDDDDGDDDVMEPLPSLLGEEDPAWNAKSPKIGTDEDSLHLKSLQEMHVPPGPPLTISYAHQQHHGRKGKEMSDSSEMESESQSSNIGTVVAEQGSSGKSRRSKVATSSSSSSSASVSVSSSTHKRCDRSSSSSKNSKRQDSKSVTSSKTTRSSYEHLKDNNIGHDDNTTPNQQIAMVKDHKKVGMSDPSSKQPTPDKGFAMADTKTARTDKCEQNLQSNNIKRNESKVLNTSKTGRQSSSSFINKKNANRNDDDDYDDDEERPWIGIATGDAIIVIDEDYDDCEDYDDDDQESECPITPPQPHRNSGSDGYETEFFETPRQYDDDLIHVVEI